MRRSFVRECRSVLLPLCLLLSSASFAQTTSAPESAPTPAPAPVRNSIGEQIRFNVEKYKLPNGLTVILHEDHSTPLVSYHTWFRVGSKDEEKGYTGIAHLFEHMMFKGAKRYKAGEFDRILQANGAVNNAFTSHDFTGYYENFPSSKLELIMDIESDRMENLQITEEQLKSEREVVKEERRYRVDNNPTGILRELMYGTAFKVHPYRWPVIGYMEDLNRISVEKANEFYRTYYAPNNAVLVIAGDIQPAKVKKLVEKYYSHLKEQPLLDRQRPAEPAQRAIRSYETARDVQNLQFVVAYHVPKTGTEESYALDLLANIMGFGNSSRMHQRLVYKDQTATSVYVANSALHDSGLFQVFVNLKPGASYSSAQKAVYGEMWRPSNIRIKEDELEKAKNQVMKGYVDSLKTVYGKAQALAINEIYFNDYERLFKDLEQYEKVTAEQVMNAAKKYLNPYQSTLVILKPKKGGGQ